MLTLGNLNKKFRRILSPIFSVLVTKIWVASGIHTEYYSWHFESEIILELKILNIKKENVYYGSI